MIIPSKNIKEKNVPQQMEAMLKLLALLKANNVQATFVESPMPYYIENSRSYKNAKTDVSELIESWGYRYVDGANGYPVDDHKNFMDGGHLSARGKQLFTEKIIRELAL